MGIYFKNLADPRTEIGVKIFGMAHGIVFIAFVIAAILGGRAMSWRIETWLLALVGNVVPLGSVAFLLWADRSAQLGPGRAKGYSPPVSLNKGERPATDSTRRKNRHNIQETQPSTSVPSSAS